MTWSTSSSANFLPPIKLAKKSEDPKIRPDLGPNRDPDFFSDSLIGNHVTPEKETKVQKLKKDGASEFKKIKISDSQYVFTMGQIEKTEEKLNNFIKGKPTHFNRMVHFKLYS